MKSRLCVNCTHEFLSTGPGNVVCPTCREAAAGETWDPVNPTTNDADTELLDFAKYLQLENAKLQVIQDGRTVYEYEADGLVTLTIERTKV